MSASAKRIAGLLLASSLLACSSPDTPANDGGADAGTDAAPDSPADAPADSPVDSPVDAPAEAEAGPCHLISPYSTKNAPCNACAEAKCCAEVNGCLGDTECNDDYVNCQLVCAFDFDAGPDAAEDAGPTDCIEACGEQYPKGKMEYDTAIGCVDQGCLTECQ